MSDMISRKSFRRFIVIIAGAGLLGAVAGFVVSQIVPEKWGAEAIVLISRAGSAPLEPPSLVLERLRSTSFLTIALERKGLGHLVRSLASTGGGQMSVSVIRQADAVKIEIQDRTAQGAIDLVTAIYEALRDELDKTIDRNRDYLLEQQKGLAAIADQSLHFSDQEGTAMNLVEILRDKRGVETLLANLEPTRLVVPISAGFRPVFPRPSYFALAGLIAGLTLGYILAVGRRLLGLRDA